MKVKVEKQSIMMEERKDHEEYCSKDSKKIKNVLSLLQAAGYFDYRSNEKV